MIRNVVALRSSYRADGTVSFLCSACGRMLTDSPTVTVEGAPVYIACAHCAIPHVKTPTGLARVDWNDVDPVIADWMREVIAHYWNRCIVVARAYRAA